MHFYSLMQVYGLDISEMAGLNVVVLSLTRRWRLSGVLCQDLLSLSGEFLKDYLME
jgi:hypothetical protein